MSANFILEYAGAPVKFSSGGHELVTEEEATPFVLEYSAWYEALRAGLNPKHCRVVNLYARNQHPATRIQPQ